MFKLKNWGWGVISSERIKEHTGNLHSESEHASFTIISLDSKYSRDVTPPPPPRRLHVSSYRSRMWHNCTRSKSCGLTVAGLCWREWVCTKPQQLIMNSKKITNYLKPEIKPQALQKCQDLKQTKLNNKSDGQLAKKPREIISSPAWLRIFCKVEWLVKYLGACQEDLVKQEQKCHTKGKVKRCPAGRMLGRMLKVFVVAINSSAM